NVGGCSTTLSAKAAAVSCAPGTLWKATWMNLLRNLTPCSKVLPKLFRTCFNIVAAEIGGGGLGNCPCGVRLLTSAATANWGYELGDTDPNYERLYPGARQRLLARLEACSEPSKVLVGGQ